MPQCFRMPHPFIHKISIDSIPWGSHFLSKTVPKSWLHQTPKFLLWQNLLSFLTTCPELWISSVIGNMRPSVFPFLAQLCLSNCTGWSFSSTQSTLHVTDLPWSPSVTELCSFPKRWGLWDKALNMGQFLFLWSSIDSFTQLLLRGKMQNYMVQIGE